MNTAEKLRAVEVCSCGKFYPSQEGVAACQANKHGSGKDSLDGRIRFLTTLETEYSVFCAECGERLRSRVYREKGNIKIDVLPHVCAVDEEER